MRFEAPHVTFRNGHPYFMIRVPSDFIHKFHFQQYIRKALKTKSPVEAKLLAESMTLKARTSFTLLRSGMLSDELEQSIVVSYTFHKRTRSERQALRLKDLLFVVAS